MEPKMTKTTALTWMPSQSLPQKPRLRRPDEPRPPERPEPPTFFGGGRVAVPVAFPLPLGGSPLSLSAREESESKRLGTSAYSINRPRLRSKYITIPKPSLPRDMRDALVVGALGILNRILGLAEALVIGIDLRLDACDLLG